MCNRIDHVKQSNNPSQPISKVMSVGRRVVPRAMLSPLGYKLWERPCKVLPTPKDWSEWLRCRKSDEGDGDGFAKGSFGVG